MLTRESIESTVYTPVVEELDQVLMTLMAVADEEDSSGIQNDEAVQERLEHVLASPGKRIRPAITLLTTRLSGDAPNETAIMMAAAVELLHVATLVHDDMVDSADLRRGRATASNLWGGRVAVLLGDYLFAASARFVCDTNNIRVVRQFAETIMQLSNGELSELMSCFSPDQTRELYLTRINHKTASLFTTASETGAVLAGYAEDDVQRMSRYGYKLGMAYQIMDDVLDFTSSSETLGKPACNDLRQGILTLPSIRLMERSPGDNAILDFVNGAPDDRELLLARAADEIRAAGFLDECIGEATGYSNSARVELDTFPDSASKASLIALTEFVQQRDS